VGRAAAAARTRSVERRDATRCERATGAAKRAAGAAGRAAAVAVTQNVGRGAVSIS
jgi:hypothetical protein